MNPPCLPQNVSMDGDIASGFTLWWFETSLCVRVLVDEDRVSLISERRNLTGVNMKLSYMHGLHKQIRRGDVPFTLTVSKFGVSAQSGMRDPVGHKRVGYNGNEGARPRLFLSRFQATRSSIIRLLVSKSDSYPKC